MSMYVIKNEKRSSNNLSTNDNKGAGNEQPRRRYERFMNLLKNSKDHVYLGQKMGH